MKKYILIYLLILPIFFLLMSLLPNGLVRTVYAETCTPGSYDRRCTGNCGGCATNAGEQEVKQCNSAGTGYGSSHGECSTSCAGPCQSQTTPPAAPPPPSTGPGSCGRTQASDWCGCSDWTSVCSATPCTTDQGKAGVVCTATCNACGWKNTGMTFNGSCYAGGTWTVCFVPPPTPSPRPCDVTANLSAACAACVLTEKNSRGGNLVNDMIHADNLRFGACSSQQIVSYWCSGGVSQAATSECSSIRSGVCSSQCAGSVVPTPSPKPVCSGDACTDCVLTNRSDILPYYESHGNDISCGKQVGIVNNWCGIDPTGCNNVKSNQCAAQCGRATPAPTSTPASTPTPPPATTTKFRIAENPTDLAAAPWQNYTAAVASTPLDYTFKDTTPGLKFIFVQFMDSNGNTTTAADCPKCQAQIKLLGPDPAMTGCSLTLEGTNAVLNLAGQNFGSDKGTIKSGDSDLQIRSWKNDSIQAVLQNAPTGQVLPITFTNTDEQTGNGLCSSISQLALGAKVFCRAPASYDTNNVDLVLVKEDGTKIHQTVTIDKNGAVQGLTQRLEDGKRYTLSIKAPKSLRRNATFTAGDGTVNIPNFILPVGDIFPADGGDGAINALDKSELNREWIISEDAKGRLGDFNQDSRINSIDWACMRYDYGKSDDQQPTPPATSGSGSTPAPSPEVTILPTSSPKSTCQPRPACLDATPHACKIPEPAEGWCPTPSPSSTNTTSI